MLRALLINPHRLIPKEISFTQVHSPPLGLAYIAAICEEQGFKVDIYDAIAEAPDNYSDFENSIDLLIHGAEFSHFFNKYNHQNFTVIGVTLMFTNNWLINRTFINELKIRFPDSLIIAGGEHASALPAFCLNDCKGLDVIVIGEGENSMKEICNHISDTTSLQNIEGICYRDKDSKQIITNNKRKREYDIQSLPMPAWHVFPLDKYFASNASYGVTTERSLPIFATRGCPYSCTFCSSPQMWGTKYLMRDYRSVVDEIIYLHTTYNVINFDFYDLTAIIKKEWIINFCRTILDYKLNITFQMPAGTRAEAIDAEVAELLFKSGCKFITYAPESGSVRILKKIKKKVNLNNMLKSISDSYKSGISVKLNMIMGFPDEKITDIFQTWKFLIKCSYYGVHDTAPAFLSPYPGSEIFNDLEANNKIHLNDEYFYNIALSESLFSFKSYNTNINKRILILLHLITIFIFYSSNYLFRPARFFALITSLLTKKYTSRGTYILSKKIKGTIYNNNSIFHIGKSINISKPIKYLFNTILLLFILELMLFFMDYKTIRANILDNEAFIVLGDDSVFLLPFYKSDSFGFMKPNFMYNHDEKIPIYFNKFTTIEAYLKNSIYNEEGFRGNSINNIPENKKKIMFIGDSYVFGYDAFPLTNSFVDIIQKKDTNLYCINFGIGGADLATYELISKVYIPKVRPDIVICCIYDNDYVYYDKKLKSYKINDIYISNFGAIFTEDYSYSADSLQLFDSYTDAYNNIKNKIYYKPPVNKFEGLLQNYSRIYAIIANKFLLENHIVMSKKIKKENYTMHFMNSIKEECAKNNSKLIFTIIPSFGKPEYKDNVAVIKANINDSIQTYYPHGLNLSHYDFNQNHTFHFNNKGYKFYADFLYHLIDSTIIN